MKGNDDFFPGNIGADESGDLRKFSYGSKWRVPGGTPLSA
jgi:hypothetical protein